MQTRSGGDERTLLTHRKLAGTADMSKPNTPPSPSHSSKVAHSEPGSDLPLSPTRQDNSSTTGILPSKEDDIEKGKGGCCYPETRWWAVVVRLGIVLVAGVVFGWCLEKGRGK